jgi:hypothetical protein
MRATLATMIAVGLGAFAFGFWSEDRFGAIGGFFHVVHPLPVAVLCMVLFSVVLRSYRSKSSQ